jgi:Na+-transporting methylmalonyl-CoA/oxaloacetate decarboxylase gamma subunit
MSLSEPLQITIIGMSLVFGAILLLWALMALIVRLGGEDADDEEQLIIVSSSEPDEMKMMEMAAVAAVTGALAQQLDSTQPHPFPLPPTPIVSAWQAVLRSRMLTRRGNRR